MCGRDGAIQLSGSWQLCMHPFGSQQEIVAMSIHCMHPSAERTPAEPLHRINSISDIGCLGIAQSQLASEEERSARLEAEVGALRDTTRRGLSLAPRASLGPLERTTGRVPRASSGASPPQASQSPLAAGLLNRTARASSGALPGQGRPSLGAPRASTTLGNRASNASMSSTSLRNLLQVGHQFAQGPCSWRSPPFRLLTMPVLHAMCLLASSQASNLFE